MFSLRDTILLCVDRFITMSPLLKDIFNASETKLYGPTKVSIPSISLLMINTLFGSTKLN